MQWLFVLQVRSARDVFGISKWRFHRRENWASFIACFWHRISRSPGRWPQNLQFIMYSFSATKHILAGSKFLPSMVFSSIWTLVSEQLWSRIQHWCMRQKSKVNDSNLVCCCRQSLSNENCTWMCSCAQIRKTMFLFKCQSSGLKKCTDIQWHPMGWAVFSHLWALDNTSGLSVAG